MTVPIALFRSLSERSSLCYILPGPCRPSKPWVSCLVSDLGTGEGTRSCFHCFVSNLFSLTVSTHSTPLISFPCSYPPRSLGRESLFRDCKITKINALYPALPEVTVPRVRYAGRPRAKLKALHSAPEESELQPRRKHKRTYQTHRSGHCSLLCPS